MQIVQRPHRVGEPRPEAAFIATSRPRLAVISIGLDSPHGHPQPSVIKRWRACGAEVLTTGERGAIALRTDGDDLRVKTFVKQ